MIKLAVIRGANLNKFEMQNYEPLYPENEVVGFTARKHLFETDLISFPTKELRSVYDIPLPKIRGPLFNYLSGNSDVMFGLEKELNGYDIAHVAEVGNYYSYQAIRARQKGMVKKVVLTSWENIPRIENVRHYEKKLRVKIINGVDHFLAITERAKMVLELENVKSDNISVIPMGVDLRRFYPAPKDRNLLNDLGLSADELVILTICSLNYLKGVTVLIYAFKFLLNQFAAQRQLKLVIVGRGPLSHHIKKLVSALGIKQSVIMLPGISYEQIPSVHRIADIFTLLSIPSMTEWQEQLGMVLIEAMACGKPIIAAASGSIPEVIGEAGLLVQPADVKSTVEAFSRLIENPSQRDRLSKLAGQRARKQFNAETIAQKIEAMYQHVLSGA